MNKPITIPAIMAACEARWIPWEFDTGIDDGDGEGISLVPACGKASVDEKNSGTPSGVLTPVATGGRPVVVGGVSVFGVLVMLGMLRVLETKIMVVGGGSIEVEGTVVVGAVSGELWVFELWKEVEYVADEVGGGPWGLEVLPGGVVRGPALGHFGWLGFMLQSLGGFAFFSCWWVSLSECRLGERIMLPPGGWGRMGITWLWPATDKYRKRMG
jgi:hypothetical protein